MGDNRLNRVFVSSTFRDMKEDRDKLMNQAWPDCAAFAASDRSTLDLGWDIALEQCTRNEAPQTLPRRNPPLPPVLIGPLGERDGWSRQRSGSESFRAQGIEAASRLSLAGIPQKRLLEPMSERPA